MLITYLKQTGELVPPIMTSEKPLTLIDALGEEKGQIYSAIYDYINIEDNMDIFDNTKQYYVDVETKQLKYKKHSKIKYL